VLKKLEVYRGVYICSQYLHDVKVHNTHKGLTIRVPKGFIE